ncbi:MAG: hypothetical protein A2504_02160 [Bdellovibrionales bacterium RIFOXYD12_FULL_39_22]|nr:MAG: hypothetical protein A2385_12185 [Bdellovibrionales bacterium RIFOXYB1_FULL_39_21]OFZ41400.1 MAG: hypothetical protein A2485_01355 [Bdellovibrionales bacterium RIFOXYC12_FULL_39_17]OFZ45355.1 MAG: hypothetical protein A2404_13370 [Bdellovibrionales bacterium RIFOXYC1_FULL_39_130]OFZ74551.1 MAG: hypothetical protein A2560_12475 [Bdellovibrionales bacterium RIFOXYD1_FULL_39_84]OFZ92560.1 MAG: hypothetical protein A2504_02160 [Bdellovibrionales bacterium RIFOXYD12_FULL_39_22]
MLCANVAQALIVTHQLRPNGNFETVALGNACSTIAKENFSARCNPALFSYSQEDDVSVIFAGKSDGNSIDNGHNLIFYPITEEMVRKIFQTSSFTTFSFNSDFVFKAKMFEIAYSPYYLLADLYMFNPAFPEISLYIVNHENLRLTSGRKLGQSTIFSNTFSLSAGGSIFYYEHGFANTVFSVFDLALSSPEDLVQMKTIYGVAADLGFFVDNDSLFFPKLALQIKNINSKINDGHDQRNDLGTAAVMQTNFLFETYSTLGLGKNLKTTYGAFDLSLEIPFYGYFLELGQEHIIMSSRYNIGLFSLLFSSGKYFQSWGMRFNSQYLNIGLTYSRESCLGSAQQSTEHSIYTGIDIIL